MKSYSYSERLIAFIDVLGFRALIDKSANSGTDSIPIIDGIANAVIGALDDLDDVDSPHDYVITQFSDSFVISCAIPSASSYSEKTRSRFSLFFVVRLAAIMHNFLASGMLLRGGITSGQLIHDSRLLFGPAMVRAYDLESKIARVPRIILDPSLVKIFDDDFLRMSFAEDDDKYLYLNLFSPPMAHYYVPSHLLQLQQTIENIPKAVELEEKRKWLVQNYNTALDNFSPSEFELYLKNKVDDLDCNPMVSADFDKLLAPSKQLRKLNVG